MLECKTSHDSDIRGPYAAETAKYVDDYGAQYAALVVPSFGGDVLLARELQAHDVSAWEIGDLIALLEAGSNPLEMRPLFEAVYVEGRIRDLLWERERGRPKRVAVVCDILLATAHAAQSTALGSPKDALLLDEDAAMLTVDSALVAQGAHVPCTRDDVRAAFAHLCDPLVGLAVFVEKWAGNRRLRAVTYSCADFLARIKRGPRETDVRATALAQAMRLPHNLDSEPVQALRRRGVTK